MRERIQLRCTKGWRLPPNTVKVDRSTKWGNPFVVGPDGDSARCVDLFTKLLCGLVCLGRSDIKTQQAYLAMVQRDRAELRGKNLACWCRPGRPCHADVLLQLRQHDDRQECAAPPAQGELP